MYRKDKRVWHINRAESLRRVTAKDKKKRCKLLWNNVINGQKRGNRSNLNNRQFFALGGERTIFER